MNGKQGDLPNPDTMVTVDLLSRLRCLWACYVLNRHPDTHVYLGYGPLAGVTIDVCDHCRKFVYWTRKER